MMQPDKLAAALYALQGVLIRARVIALTNAAPENIADILDRAEMLPRLIASNSSDTEMYRRHLSKIALKYKCAYVLDRFDHAPPTDW